MSATDAWIDLANHALGARPWTVPHVDAPPQRAMLLKPIRSWLLEPMLRLRVALGVLLPFATVVLTFVAMLVG